MVYKKSSRKSWFFAKKCAYVLGMFLGLLISISACSKDPDEMKPDPQQQQPQTPQDTVTPQDTTSSQDNPLDPDLISEHLLLKEATKMMGDLPTATDGQIKMDIRDTIFLVKGYPLGTRIQFLHHPSQKISGFNIHVSGSTFYYHVPEAIEEGQHIPPEESDSTSVLVLDLDLPDGEEVDYPFSTDIIIQPVDDSGMPGDQTTRIVTIEDPDDNGQNGGCNTITQPFDGNGSSGRWRWDFTTREYNGDILNVLEPNRGQVINSEGGGCCSDSGQSYSVSDSPSCVPNVSGNGMTWVTLEVNDYVIRIEEYLWFYENGVFDAQGIEDKKTYDRSATNFCTGEVGFQYQYQVYGSPNDTPVGTHDFTPGATRLNLDLPNWQGPYRMPRNAEIVYTCHTLFLMWGSEDQWTSRYEDYSSYYGQNQSWYD